MVEPYLRQSPLAHLGLDARAVSDPGSAAVSLCERRFFALVNLRGRPRDAAFLDAIESTLTLRLPTTANTTATAADGAVSALWLGPDEWWITAADPAPEAGPRLAARLREALGGRPGAVTDISESRACIRIAGPRARAVLQKGCPLDLHASVFGAGQCAQSHVSKADVVLHLVAENGTNGAAPGAATFDVYVLRSFAEYLWRWLADAGREYGVAIGPSR